MASYHHHIIILNTAIRKIDFQMIIGGK